MTRLRLAVVGVGHLGKEHARILSNQPDVELVGVVDANGSQAAQVAEALPNQGLPRSSLAPGPRGRGRDCRAHVAPPHRGLGLPPPGHSGAGGKTHVFQPGPGRRAACPGPAPGAGPPGWPHRALQSGVRGIAAPAVAAQVHQLRAPGQLQRPFHRRRRRSRPDDPRPGPGAEPGAVAGARGGSPGRGGAGRP